jgi:hypothetical protein
MVAQPNTLPTDTEDSPARNRLPSGATKQAAGEQLDYQQASLFGTEHGRFTYTRVPGV